MAPQAPIEASAPELLAVFEESRQRGVPDAAFWIGELQRARFRLGQPPQEIKIPFSFGSETEQALGRAVEEVGHLAGMRYGLEATAEGRPAAAPSTLQGKLPDRTYRTGRWRPDSLERRFVERMLTWSPVLDAGVLGFWVSREGGGSRLFAEARTLYLKTLEEEILGDGRERTAFLAHLALLQLLAAKKSALKGLSLKGVSYERAERAFGLALVALLQEVQESCFQTLAERHVRYDWRPTQLLIRTSTTPFTLVSIKQALIADGLNPYGLPGPLCQRIAERIAGVPMVQSQVQAFAQQLRALAAEDEGTREEFLAGWLESEFRRLAFPYLFECSGPRDDLSVQLRTLCHDSRRLRGLLLDERERRGFRDALEAQQSAAQDRVRQERLAPLLEFLTALSRRGLQGVTEAGSGGDSPADAAVSRFLEGYLRFRWEAYADQFVGQACAMFEDRGKRFGVRELQRDYQAGRLYRFAADRKPTLAGLALQTEGQLFVDLKGFTAKTVRAKEIAMADFMQTEFYEPLLKTARQYDVEVGTQESRRIELNNLLGDAACFSGSVEALVSLAADIHRLGRAYERKLLAKSPDLSANPGEALESGTFITFGPAAETLRMRDDVWGEVRVAIGSRINEAARGTARNAEVRHHVEHRLELERERAGTSQLQPAFKVFIEPVDKRAFPPELGTALGEALERRDPEAARQAVEAIAKGLWTEVRDRLQGGETASRFLSQSPDIYNVGEALSGEALQAYLEETKATRLAFTRTVPVAELHPEIRQRFFFTESELRLVISARLGEGQPDVHIFRLAGEMTFRGFEEQGRTTAVYEIVRRDSPIYAALMAHHFTAWLQEAQREKPRPS
ncbi:MAG: hypothetical protein HYY85_08545 [Deltaproteobacteria bacterium]|nr:hypothetical protein [Deltaproteobacteria bacterium]